MMSSFEMFDVIYSFECSKIRKMLSKSKTKSPSGEVYFFMIDSSDERSINEKIDCFKVLLEFYPRPQQQFQTMIELDKQINRENESRLDVLSLVAEKNGKYVNRDVRGLIKEFL